MAAAPVVAATVFTSVEVTTMALTTAEAMATVTAAEDDSNSGNAAEAMMPMTAVMLGGDSNSGKYVTIN